MVIAPEMRARLSIAASPSELILFCDRIWKGDASIAVRLIPFGGSQTDEVVIHDEFDLVRSGVPLFDKAVFGYVHIFNSRRP